MTFADLGVPSSLAQILEQQGITTPTPIQAATLPDSLAGRDVLGRGRTGSGKTYGFLLPLVARLDASKLPAMPRKPRALILAPTRELVTQIDAALQPLATVAAPTAPARRSRERCGSDPGRGTRWCMAALACLCCSISDRPALAGPNASCPCLNPSGQNW